MTRRAERDDSGAVVRASRPTIQGNCPYSVLVSQILETESVTQKLLAYTLNDSPTKEFRVRQGLGIVIQVLNLLHKDADSFEFEDVRPDSEDTDKDRVPPYFVQQFTKILPESGEEVDMDPEKEWGVLMVPVAEHTGHVTFFADQSGYIYANNTNTRMSIPDSPEFNDSWVLLKDEQELISLQQIK